MDGPGKSSTLTGDRCQKKNLSRKKKEKAKKSQNGPARNNLAFEAPVEKKGEKTSRKTSTAGGSGEGSRERPVSSNGNKK